MAEYYAGTLNAKNKNLWQSKEEIEADYDANEVMAEVWY